MKVLFAITLLLSVSSIQSFVIWCFYTSGSWKFISDDVYTCIGSVVLSGDSKEVESAEGVPEPGRTVEGLILQSTSLTSIPKNISVLFENLKGVSLSQSKISHVFASDLQQLPELIYFRISGNQISSISGDLFTNSPNLMHIDFDDNQLQSVGNNLLGQLEKLQEANFHGNPCIDNGAASTDEIERLNVLLPLRCPPKMARFIKNN
jgi:Leucine-rich repeat (LRR) protein